MSLSYNRAIRPTLIREAKLIFDRDSSSDNASAGKGLWEAILVVRSIFTGAGQYFRLKELGLLTSEQKKLIRIHTCLTFIVIESAQGEYHFYDGMGVHRAIVSAEEVGKFDCFSLAEDRNALRDRTFCATFRKGKSLRSRRYRNRQLGVFLKELGLTEGRATGIPTIQLKLAQNGSPAAHIETDEDRSYFLIDIPCHPHFSESSTPSIQESEKRARIESLSKVLNEFLRAYNKQFVETDETNCPKSVLSLYNDDELTIAASLLDSLETPHSSKELMVLSSQTNRSRMLNRYLKPLIRRGLIQLTLPHIPNSSKQQYMLTSLGMELLKKARE